jgi:hypothetical protein
MGNLEGGSLPFVPKLSLGNFEGAYAACISQPLAIKNEKQSVSCPKGNIAELKYFGALRGDEVTTILLDDGPFKGLSE